MRPEKTVVHSNNYPADEVGTEVLQVSGDTIIVNGGTHIVVDVTDLVHTPDEQTFEMYRTTGEYVSQHRSQADAVAAALADAAMLASLY